MSANLDSDLLRTFVAIADSGSFTGAAKMVHRTQSAVSMQIKRLEETIGSELFIRAGRSVSLTTDGEALLGYARRILRLQDQALARLAEPTMAGSGPHRRTGRLRHPIHAGHSFPLCRVTPERAG